MIASCPQCNSRYRIAREKIGPSGARIRCSRCETIFRVEPPGPRPGDAIPHAPTPVAQTAPAPEVGAAAPPAPVPAPQAAPAQPASAPPVAAQSAPPAAPVPEAPAPRARALLAEGDAEIAKSIAAFLETWGIDVDVVHNGADALLRLFRQKPDFAVLGGHLPGVGSPALTEVLRRTSERRELPVIRVAPMDEPAGAPEFDANETLEPGDLPEGLGSLLGRLGFGSRPVPEPQREAPVAPEPAAAVQPEPAAQPFTPPVAEPPAAPMAPPAAASPVAEPAAATPEAPAVEAPAASPRRRRRPPLSDDPEIAAAERLARIAVSDVILYNEEKFAQAVATGNVAEAMAGDIEEARNHFNQRIPEAVRSQRDFLIEELERRAVALAG